MKRMKRIWSFVVLAAVLLAMFVPGFQAQAQENEQKFSYFLPYLQTPPLPLPSTVTEFLRGVKADCHPTDYNCRPLEIGDIKMEKGSGSSIGFVYVPRTDGSTYRMNNPWVYFQAGWLGDPDARELCGLADGTGIPAGMTGWKVEGFSFYFNPAPFPTMEKQSVQQRCPDYQEAEPTSFPQTVDAFLKLASAPCKENEPYCRVLDPEDVKIVKANDGKVLGFEINPRQDGTIFRMNNPWGLQAAWLAGAAVRKACGINPEEEELYGLPVDTGIPGGVEAWLTEGASIYEDPGIWRMIPNQTADQRCPDLVAP